MLEDTWEKWEGIQCGEVTILNSQTQLQAFVSESREGRKKFQLRDSTE